MHPLLGADLPSLARLIATNGAVSPRALPMVLAAGASALGRLPFTFAERALVARLKRRKERDEGPMPAPVFIIGHWRSGTTHLYNLLTRSDFGYVSPIAAGLPHDFLTLGRWLRPLLLSLLPKTRYVDGMEVRPDSPQEDEIPLAAMNPISFYHGIYFPKRFHHHFGRGMFLEGCSAPEIEAWERAFVHLVEKTWLDHGRRVMIKNPTYSCRIPLLRALYPDARFIHLYRHPYDVFRSTRHFYRTLLEQFAFQPFDHLDLDRIALDGYARLMQKVETDKRALPASRFIEVRYETLEADPLGEIGRIYAQLEFGDMRSAEPAIRAHLRLVEGFQKAAFAPSSSDHDLVNGNLSMFFDRLDYAPPALEPG